MSGRVLVISWDGATFDVLDPLISHGNMPHLAQLIDAGARARLRSCVPPVSAAAWASFQTGKNPGKHGVFEFLSYVPGQYEPEIVSATSIRAATLWELLSRSGKRCIVINVPVTYPPKPVNGLLISGFLTPAVAGKALRQSKFTFPEELKDEIFQRVDYEIHAYPRAAWQKGAVQFVKDLTSIEEKRLDLTEYLAARYEWDFLMVHIHCTDTLQHMLWDRVQRVSQAGQPQDDLDQLILDFFSLIDRGIERLGRMLDNDDYLILLSDHGFGPVTHTFHVNDWLMSEGFLSPKARGVGLQELRWAKRTLKKLDVFNLRLRSRLLHRSSPLQRLKRLELPSVVDWSRTKAFALMGTVNAGIFVNLRGREPKGIVEGDEYEQMCRELVRRAEHINGILQGFRAYRREDLYSGPHLDLMPDVVLIPGEEYHIATMLSETGSLVSESPPNQRSNHRLDGILVIRGGGIKQEALTDASIVDLAPTILHLFNVDIPSDVDGKVLVRGAGMTGHTGATVTETNWTTKSVERNSYSREEEEKVRRRLADLGYLD